MYRPAERDLSMAGFVAVGTGGTITLSESKKNELALEFVVPSIANVIGINLGLDWAKTVTTDLTLGPAHIRRLRPDPMYSLIADLPASSMMKRAFTDGDLVLTVLDIVVDKMTVTLQVNRALNPSLDAQLKQKAMDWVGASQSNLNVSLVQVTEDSYTLEIGQPVVVCVWPKRQRQPGVFGAGGMVEETILIDPADSWSDWRNLSQPTSVVPVAP